jgi:cysteine desulfurase
MSTGTPGLTDRPIYLDYNATTSVHPPGRRSDATVPAHALRQSVQCHEYATPAAQALETARQRLAALIGAHPAGIVFTGSGSEANNLALRGTVLAARVERPHVITQTTEHPAILATYRALQRLHGIDVTYLPVDGHGHV